MEGALRTPGKGDSGRRHAPPDETPVMVGWVKNEAHLAWIREKGCYNVRAGSARGSIVLSPQMAGARYLLLHGPGGMAVDGLLRITGRGPRVYSLESLVGKLGYPGTARAEYYLVYRVEADETLAGYAWDYSKLVHPSGRQSAEPFASTLAAVMQAVHEQKRA